jgi:hypothetical protein
LDQALGEDELGKELVMPKKRFSAEQIVTLLRLIEVLMAQGKSAPVYRSNCIIHAATRSHRKLN